MPRPKKATKQATRVGKRASNYSYKLKALRTIVSGFDSKEFDKAYSAKPRTKAGKAARAKKLASVRSHFARVRPFVHRSHKVVKVKNRAHLEELRKHVGLTKLKGLRAVPVPSPKPGKTRVKFDKKGRVTVTVGAREEKIFRFPHMPRSADDAIEMLEAMLPDMPFGFYLLATRHHFLLHGIIERDSLVGELRAFFHQYRASPEFLRLLYGVKWLARSEKAAKERRTLERTERGRNKLERKRVASEKAARQIAAMDKAFKRLGSMEFVKGAKRKRPRLSERARKTGRR
jgi:hypothetical protein